MSRRSPMMGEAGYVRLAHDAYMTPAWITEALIERVPLRPPVWEPACGTGQMAEVLATRYPLILSDLRKYGYKSAAIYDFLAAAKPPPEQGWGTICTNPPYEHAQDFLVCALARTQQDGGMVCLLLRNEFDCAKGRMALFERPFARKIVLTKRPRWFEHDKASPRFHFSWFIWDWQHFGRPTLEYA